MTCPFYQFEGTSFDATQNFSSCFFVLPTPATQNNFPLVRLDNCGCVGDSVLRMFHPDGRELLFNDDSQLCTAPGTSSCSAFDFQFSIGNYDTGLYELRTGCYEAKTCSSTPQIIGAGGNNNCTSLL